jgi:flavocytochrome c
MTEKKTEGAADVTRRDFIKLAGGAAAAAGVAAGGVLWSPGTAQAAGLPDKWDEEWDVVVIGSGFAGLSAAIEARIAGASVQIVEKMPVPGGNSTINGGDFAAAGSRIQKQEGIDDNPELMLKDMLKAGLYLNHVEKARMVAEQSNSALEWCIDYLGAGFSGVGFHGGHSVKRAHHTSNGSGSEVISKMLAKAKALGVNLNMRARLQRLVRNNEGRIVGIEIRKGYRFGDETGGQPAFVKAKRSVVLASGGFSQDVNLRCIHDPRLDVKFESTNQPGATGEVLLAACMAGAMDVHMDWIQLGPWTSPDETGFGYVPFFCERLVGYAPMINPQTGKRFFKETGNRKERADAIILIGSPVIIFGDAETVTKRIYPPKALEGGMKTGSILKFERLEDVGAHFSMPMDAFLQEVAKWNAFVAQKKDTDFDCMIFPDAKPTLTPPFYAARLWPKVHHTMGGLLVDTQGRVTGFDSKPIQGLYAAGELTGGVHGAVRLGGCAGTECIVFGRIAGRNAANEKSWS